MEQKSPNQIDREKAEEKAKLIQELRDRVIQQITGEIDWVHARTYWERRLPEIDPALLAEALSYALCRVKNVSYKF
jgi:outer membrane lipopolysaccharide assembly protein LptE/RlpB